jgi:hypothetical protein
MGGSSRTDSICMGAFLLKPAAVVDEIRRVMGRVLSRGPSLTRVEYTMGWVFSPLWRPHFVTPC